MSLNVVLYTSGLFGRNVAANQSQLFALQESGFTTLILWTLVVESDGTLLYNNIPIVQDGCFVNTFNYLPELITGLVSTGSVQKVLFSIGAAGVDAFNNVQKLLAEPFDKGKRKLMQNFNALATALPINGYDFDDETLYDPATTATLTEMLCGGNNMTVTYCPALQVYQSDWNSALEMTYAYNQTQKPPLTQSVEWWNLQCYDGGAGNNPLSWAKSLPKNAGITNPESFIIPGFGANQPPESVQEAFSAYQGTSINGGFLFNSAAIFASQYTPQQYARAIINGLQGTGSAEKGAPASVSA